MAERNYLIGFGQRLARPISLKKGGGDKFYPYTFDEAKARLSDDLTETIESIEALPDLACPSDRTVISITLHPSFLARSYYPTDLLRDLNLRAVGSRAKPVVVEKSNKKPKAGLKAFIAPELFVSGQREDLSNFVDDMARWYPAASVQDDFRKIEAISNLNDSRLKEIETENEIVPLEVVLHASEANGDDYIIDGFRKFAKKIGIKVDLDQRLHAGGLCFIPMRAPRDLLHELTEFSFIRLVRQMPKLSLNETVIRTASLPGSFQAKIPRGNPVNSEVKTAIFDGGMPDEHPIGSFVNSRDADGVGPAVRAYQAHGLGVTSALLFGPLERGKEAPLPYSKVDHWRVLDSNTRGDDFELFAVLRRIMNVLRQREYDYVCLSIGPALPIDDDPVHIWTSSIDTYLSSRKTLLVTACGNTGEDDWECGKARIQPCADAVNAVGVGSANSEGPKWLRAPYSSIGPGRTPGFVKPDVISFGGSEEEPFWILDAKRSGYTAGKMGTSYAAPNAARPAVGMRSYFGEQFSGPAIKALMVHHAAKSRHQQREVGWGRLPSTLDRLVVCPNGEVTIVFQGLLEPSQYIRFPVPVPTDPLRSKIHIKATFCFFSPIDSEDSLNYTRAGLGIVFRPSTAGHPGNNKAGKPRSAHEAKPFFKNDVFHSDEYEKRRDEHKWETILRAEKSFDPGVLNQPVFDVEHHARVHGGPAARRTDIAYALIISLSSSTEPNLYNRILAAYPNQLEIMQPNIEVPVTVRR
ncbi:S8 family peptidase [Methylobacterium sp. Leaf456]|uniref:S8 family peptidase n=1 Tax=Methylobacterium sp. Leaf456 TaxID=1736382 RepID=UPI0009EC82B8|nr:S8 family peptidase [Methylobacterium sp. Leaf456]